MRPSTRIGYYFWAFPFTIHNDANSAAYGRFVDYAARQRLLLTSKAWLQSALATPDLNSAADWAFVERDNRN